MELGLSKEESLGWWDDGGGPMDVPKEGDGFPFADPGRSIISPVLVMVSSSMMRLFKGLLL